jgi:hypothetical protein
MTDRHPDILAAVERAGRESGHPETCPSQFATWWADFVAEPSNGRWMPYRDLFARCWDASAGAFCQVARRLEGHR